MTTKITTQHSFTFADLFAGIGGMRIGFEAVGGECVLTSEIDQKAMETYSANFIDSESHKFVADVTKLTKEDFPENLDVLVAGFPCQPYSMAGLRRGLEDKRGGDIFDALMRLLKEVKPRAFLFENVKGVLGHDEGKTLDHMLGLMFDQGYHVRYETLNSMTHANIPQNRERVFFVGFRYPYEAKIFNYPKPVELTKNISDCFEKGLVDDKFYYTDKTEVGKLIQHHIKEKDTIYQWRRSYARDNKSNVCPTLTANMGTGGHNVPIIVDDSGPRKLTPREVSNFQGFPEDFILPPMGISNLYKQFGNSVTVPLISRVAAQIKQTLDTPTNFSLMHPPPPHR
jgi:DNA (cytosine-5)-methyltransferase 1